MGKELLKTWITNGTARPFYARKTFTLDSPVCSGKVTVCGLGQFNLFVNGKKAGDHVLDPAWTDYRKAVQYLEFDVTDLLSEGKNVLAAEVGNGWYIMDDSDGNYTFRFPEFMPPNPNPYQPFGKTLVLSLVFEAELTDGSLVRIETDDTWKVKEHMVQCSNVYGSETIDGTKRIPDWNQASADDSSWQKAQIVPEEEKPSAPLLLQTIPPVRVIASYEGKEISVFAGKDGSAKGGRIIYDFSQNASGMLSFDVKGRKGDVIRVRPAEKLTPEGDADQMAKNWMMIDVCETCIIGEDDVWEHFELTFTYICARCISVEGCAPEQLRNIRLDAISSAGERAGTFECDDPRFMRIYDLIEKAVESNMLGVHTDCPTIERFAWQEENHLMAPACMYMKQVKKHWEKFLTDTRLSQHTADDWFYDLRGEKFYPGEGLIPSQAPCYIPNCLPVPGMGSFYDIIGWGSSIILGTKWHYEFYGDRRIIEDNYDAGMRYLAHLKSKVNEDGFINHGLGDWGNPDQMFARENVETAFLYADAETLRSFALILGKDSDAAALGEYARKVKENYNEKLLVRDEAEERYCYRIWTEKETVVTTPAAEAFPLFWGLCPQEHEADVAEALRQSVKKAGSFAAGEVGQPYIIQTLSRYGMNDLICDCVLSEHHPSYYAFVLAGETTLGEYWEDNPRSHCHDMMGHIAEWYYNGIAGIRPLEPGFKKTLIRPYLPKSVNHVKVRYDSASGPICVELTREKEEIRLDVKTHEGIETVIDRSFL